MRLLKNKAIFFQVGRFSIAGLINSLIGYLVIFSGMALGFSPYLCNVFGYSVGLCCSYFLNKNYTFKIKDADGRRFVKFLLAFSIAYLTNLVILFYLINNGVDDGVAQIGAGIGYLFIMYLISSKWVFK